MTDTTPHACPHAPLSPEVHHALLDLPVHWVKTEDELYQLIDEIDSVDRVALDTEFIKRTTFFPILALIQVNTGKAIYLVDAPRLDLTEFWQALADLPEMIWYACGEDLGIFYLLSECPPLTNVIDVQIGMAYLTGSLQMGYGRALEEVFGLNLAKSESQSDWLARPLSPEQESYAVDDVRYLLALHDVVTAALTERGIARYAAEDMMQYAKELHTLTIWRERLARSTNQPRSFIISKQALREIVLAMPTTIKTLAHTTINRTALRLYGNEIIHLIKEAKQLPDSEKPPLPAPTYEIKNKQLKDMLNQEINAFADATGVPALLLLKGRWIKELATGVMAEATQSSEQSPEAPETANQSGTSFPLPDGLCGYRKDWVESKILPLLRAHKALMVVVGEPSA